ncbi:MAG: hypothetical protein A3K75_02780 [Euryarchaeota archaeon RBG_13_61_15]|nr:MAG: hypothetical protein A3K75_02780 [Euryarchaeota archaeon RBG_13_61_15]
MEMQQVSTDAVRRKVKFDYARVRNDPTSKTMELFQHLLKQSQKAGVSSQELVQETANILQKSFRLRWVMIGLLSPVDGLYRYEVHAGMRPEAWAKQKLKVYKFEDFQLVTASYNAGEMSKQTRIYLEEDNPLSEEDIATVNRPVLMKMTRKSEGEAKENDFTDTLVLGPRDELLGWIEYSGTITGTFADPMTVRSIEVVASILSSALGSKSWHTR